MIRQLRRWLPDRALVVVADSTYAVLELLADAAGLPQPVTMVTRLRLDAALYDPARRRRVSLAPSVARASRASGSRRWRPACSIQTPPGNRSPFPGTAA